MSECETFTLITNVMTMRVTEIVSNGQNSPLCRDVLSAFLCIVKFLFHGSLFYIGTSVTELVLFVPTIINSVVLHLDTETSL